MRDRFVRGALALAVVVPALAAAQQPAAPFGPHREGTWELSVGVGATYLDNQITCCMAGLAGAGKVAPGGVLRLGYNLSSMWNLSVGAGVAYSSPATLVQPLVAITWTPNINAVTSPFVTLGAGVTSVLWSTTGAAAGHWRFTGRYGANLGVGVRRMLSDRMALRIEVREQIEHDSAPPFPLLTGTGTVGFSWFLGGHRAAVSAVNVTPAAMTLTSAGQTQQFTASVLDQNGNAMAGAGVRWSSDDQAVTVSSTGVVTAMREGVATIRATSGGVTGTAGVTVIFAPTSVTVAQASLQFNALGVTQALTATARDANGGPLSGATFTWASSNTRVATVDASGLVTAVGNGTARITATSAGKSATASVTVAQATASVAVTPLTAQVAAVGATAQLAAQALDANNRPIAGKTFTWTSDAQAVAMVSSSGLVTGMAGGTAHVTATADGRSARATVTVAPAAARVPAAVAPSGVALPAVNRRMVLEGVNFRPNSVALQPAARSALRTVATALKSIPNARWELGGYTSSMGNAQRNRRLSQQRAEAVQLYLTSLGVPANSLTAVGYGSQHPVATNRTRAGRLQNMRVEIKRLQ